MRTASLIATGFGERWRASASQLLVPAIVFACAWAMHDVPLVINDRARGYVVALQACLAPAVTVPLLITMVAAVRAGGMRGRARVLALIAAALGAAALATAIATAFMVQSGIWSPRWPSYVLWWSNFGPIAMICVGAVLIEDHSWQGRLRQAALRDARQRAADVARRTAEVRLQAARARVEPRFLFDALSAVERVYDVDAAAGNRLLDDLVTYLRAVVPDLRETSPDAGRESEIARLRRSIERAIGRDFEADAVKARP